MKKILNLRVCSGLALTGLLFMGVLPESQAITARVLGACTPNTAATEGGFANFSVHFKNAMATAGTIASTCRTEQFFQTDTISIPENPAPRDGGGLVNDLASGSYWAGLRNYSSINKYDCLVLASPLTDNAGNAQQPGQFVAIDDNQIWWGVIAHEVGHNCNAAHDAGACINGYRTLMKHNYCGGATIERFSYNGTYAGQSILAGNNAQRVYNRRSAFSAYR